MLNFFLWVIVLQILEVYITPKVFGGMGQCTSYEDLY